MIFLSITPPEPLHQFVEQIWYMRAQRGIASQDRILPTGTCELVISLGSNQINVLDEKLRPLDRAAALVHGVHTRSFMTTSYADEEVIGAHFRPGGFAAFCREPLLLLQNQHVRLDELWGDQGRALRERLMELGDPYLRMQGLQDYLLGIVSPDFWRWSHLQAAVTHLIKKPDATSIELSQFLGFSQRYCIQIFKDLLGMTPGQFSRLQRLRGVIDDLQGQSVVNWSQLALTAGFADQAHFSHEFKRFTGLTPGFYLQQQGPIPFHVPA